MKSLVITLAILGTLVISISVNATGKRSSKPLTQLQKTGRIRRAILNAQAQAKASGLSESETKALVHAAQAQVKTEEIADMKARKDARKAAAKSGSKSDPKSKSKSGSKYKASVYGSITRSSKGEIIDDGEPAPLSKEEAEIKARMEADARARMAAEANALKPIKKTP